MWSRLSPAPWAAAEAAAVAAGARGCCSRPGSPPGPAAPAYRRCLPSDAPAYSRGPYNVVRNK